MPSPLYRRLVIPAVALVVGALALTGCTSATLQTAQPSASAPAVTATAASGLPSPSASPQALHSPSASPTARVNSVAHATLSGDYTGEMTLPFAPFYPIVPGVLLFISSTEERIRVNLAPGTHPTGEVPTSKNLTLYFGVTPVGTDNYVSDDGSCKIKFERDDAIAIQATFTCTHLKSAGSPKVLDITGDFAATP